MEFSPTVFVLQLVTFGIGMWLSSLIFLPYLRKWMQSRQKKIEDQLKNAEALQKAAENLKADLDKKLNDMDKKSAEIIQKSRDEASKMKDEIVQNSRKEAELILTDARKALDSEMRAATLALRKEVGELAVDIAEKIIRGSVDAKAQDKIIQESLKELGGRKN